MDDNDSSPVERSNQAIMNLSSLAYNYLATRTLEVDATNLVAMLNKSVDDSNAPDIDSHRMRLLYFYGTLPLIFFCIISIAVNVKILGCVYWIRRPLSPTLQISLSLAGADAFSSAALGIGLVGNSFIPEGLGLKLPGTRCFLLGLEVIRIGAVIITLGHLVTLAINHYLGILKPLHYLSIMTHRMTTCLTILLWTLPLCFFMAYFNLIENEGFQSPGCKNITFLLKKNFRVMFGSLFFGPFVLMVCIYAHIFHIVRKHQASRLRFSRVGLSFRRNGSNKIHQNTYHLLAKNIKAIRTTLLILGSFMIGWMPATFLFVFVCDDCLLPFDWISKYPRFLVYSASHCLLILKTIVNPIIYAARMHEIQVATKRMRSSLCKFGRAVGDKDSLGLQSYEGIFRDRASQSKSAVCQVGHIRSTKCSQHDSKYSYTTPRSQREKTSL
ncbi:G-protein coupled receptor 12 isoform X1 [Fopius arisanus]|uniref:G-protein coupled receptor 12 isoform X1 n=1 Tax=Fopius arisanus TaxID=64838 RepID=A0A9R1TUC3_9HYME|nr:PREDICTED: G-protein coupled receptor 12-like isoform X1 [Fopius arisanus]